MDITCKPLGTQNDSTPAECYQIVIKRDGQNPQSRINTGDFGCCKSFPLVEKDFILTNINSRTHNIVLLFDSYWHSVSLLSHMAKATVLQYSHFTVF